MIAESILKNLEKPDRNMDAIWVEEAEKRLLAYRSGHLEGVQWKTYLNSAEG